MDPDILLCVKTGKKNFFYLREIGFKESPTLSSIVAPTLRVLTATGTEIADPRSPRPSPPNTAPNAPSPSFLFKMSFSLGISHSSKVNMEPVKLESRRPSSRRRFLVLRYFEEYLIKRKMVTTFICQVNVLHHDDFKI